MGEMKVPADAYYGAQTGRAVENFPISDLRFSRRFIGAIFPTTHFLTIARGTFSKGLAFADLHGAFLHLLIVAQVLIWMGAASLKKQER